MKNKFTVKNTLGMFDAYKGLAMFAVMLSHTYGFVDSLVPTNLGKAFVVFMSFLTESAMPALLIISGYSFRKTLSKNASRNNIIQLLFHIWFVFVFCRWYI